MQKVHHGGTAIGGETWNILGIDHKQHSVCCIKTFKWRASRGYGNISNYKIKENLYVSVTLKNEESHSDGKHELRIARTSNTSLRRQDELEVDLSALSKYTKIIPRSSQCPLTTDDRISYRDLLSG